MDRQFKKVPSLAEIAKRLEASGNNESTKFTFKEFDDFLLFGVKDRKKEVDD